MSSTLRSNRGSLIAFAHRQRCAGDVNSVDLPFVGTRSPKSLLSEGRRPGWSIQYAVKIVGETMSFSGGTTHIWDSVSRVDYKKAGRSIYFSLLSLERGEVGGSKRFTVSHSFSLLFSF